MPLPFPDSDTEPLSDLPSHVYAMQDRAMDKRARGECDQCERRADGDPERDHLCSVCRREIFGR